MIALTGGLRELRDFVDLYFNLYEGTKQIKLS